MEQDGARGSYRVMLMGKPCMLRDLLAVAIVSSEDMSLVAESSDSDDAEKCISASEVDIAIVIAQDSAHQDLELVRRLKQQQPDAKAVVLTADANENQFLLAVTAGADAYIDVRSPLDQLMQSLRTVSLNACVFDHKTCRAVIRRLAGGEEADGEVRLPVLAVDSIDLSELSLRERQVAELLSKGYSNKEIASTLSISVSTTKTHVSKVFRHFGVNCRRQMLPKLYSLADLIGSNASGQPGFPRLDEGAVATG